MIKNNFYFLPQPPAKKPPPKPNISYGDYSLKQHSTIEYIVCHPDSNLNGELMARKVLKRLTQGYIFHGSKATIWIIRL